MLNSNKILDEGVKYISEGLSHNSSLNELNIELEKTDDILKFLGENKKKGQILIGFSMETTNVVENSKQKLVKKTKIKKITI